MPNWTSLVTKALSPHATETFTLHLPKGATQLAISKTEANLGIQLPKELHEMYLVHNGFGFTGPDAMNGIDWHLIPVQKIKSYSKGVRNWFNETHPADAERFFAIINFGNGDAMGYLVSKSGKCGRKLSMFNHEAYEFDEEQPIQEFITIENNSFREHLKEIAG